MADYIDRQAAIDAVYDAFCYAYCDNCEKELDEDLCGDCHRKYQNWSASRKTVERVINALPSAERHGEWIQKSTGGESFYTCSRCGFIAWEHEDTNYCPNCGAKMEVENRC